MKAPQIPELFVVAWPPYSPIIRSSGLIGFLSDFYHMSVRRPYIKPPKFQFIRTSINPRGIPSKLSNLKCLVICSSNYVQEMLSTALLSVRVRQDARTWSPHIWSPLHELMDCVSVIYQIMFQEMQKFLESRLDLLTKMVSTISYLKLTDGRSYPNRNSTVGSIRIAASSSIFFS